MKSSKVEIINNSVQELPFTSIIKTFTQKEINIEGRVSINFEGLDSPLEFDVIVYPQYPFKSYDSESIKFINKDLLEYNHVMGDGVICIHTSHCINIQEKLIIDFNSLINWINKYYLNRDNDTHYEHLIVPESLLNDNFHSFIFTDVDYTFKKNQFGFVNLSHLNKGKYKGKRIINSITQGFLCDYGDELATCKWSPAYKNIGSPNHGLFIFLEDQPAIHNRFVFQNWKYFIDYFEEGFLNFLHHCEKKYLKQKRKDQIIPLYIGYDIPDSEIHWQVALLKVGNFPIKGVKKSQKWHTVLKEGAVNWAITRNSSYKYFFGRGVFSDTLINRRILIIGVGAIGSIVARTLTKGGCKEIDLADYDVKEPENVCRAEFNFSTGLIDKVEELSSILSHISPFVETGTVNQSYMEIISKALFQEPNFKEELEEFLNSYDLIFDCSTDNDLMYILDSLSLTTDLINLSITNHANELVCAFYPNVYGFVTKQFSEILNNDTEDLYNPTGCWSPTFKASYNDINVLIQTALKNIDQVFKNNTLKNNFVIESKFDNEIKIELREY